MLGSRAMGLSGLWGASRFGIIRHGGTYLRIVARRELQFSTFESKKSVPALFEPLGLGLLIHSNN